MSSKYVKRITLFKIPNEEDVAAALEQYAAMRSNAQKDGAPYIVANEANRVLNGSEERAQGYTVVSVTTFKSKEDVEYYDKHCAAHRALREWITPRRTGFATLHFESDIGPGQ